MFVRTILAVSLSCIFAGTAFAAATAEQPLNPQIVKATKTNVVNDTAVVVDTPTTLTQQEQQDLTQAAQTLDALQDAEDLVPTSASMPRAASEALSPIAQSAASEPSVAQTSPSEASPTPETKTTAPVKASWTLDGLNKAEWYENIGNGQFPVYARAHVMLNNAHASPGAIDGSSGKNTLKAISAFQQMNGLKPTGILTKETWDALVKRQGSKPAFVEHTLTAADVKGPFAKSIPSDYALQAKMPGLYYTRVSEALGEKFHMDEDFLKKLNPNAKFVAGEKILVANVRNDLPEDIHLIVAVKSARQLYLFNSRNQMIASFPATIGGTNTPSPTGTHKIVGVAKNPYYSYSPSNFIQGNNRKPLSLPPGPNGPVGNIWIGLSKPSFGIHGTPNPSMISKSFSHGCIRLTNWDANDLGRKVRSGVTVIFKE